MTVSGVFASEALLYETLSTYSNFGSRVFALEAKLEGHVLRIRLVRKHVYLQGTAFFFLAAWLRRVRFPLFAIAGERILVLFSICV